MNMKDTVILLILLLAVVGLIIGVYYTEADTIVNNSDNSEEVIYEDSNGIITITLEPKESESYLKGFFT